MDNATFTAIQAGIVAIIGAISAAIFGIYDRRRLARKEGEEGDRGFFKDANENWRAIIVEHKAEAERLRIENKALEKEIDILWATIHSLHDTASRIRHEAVNRLFTKFLKRKETEPNAVFLELEDLPSVHIIYNRTKDSERTK